MGLRFKVIGSDTLNFRVATSVVFFLLALALVLAPGSLAFAATYQLSGHVTDTAGNPLADFTIVVIDPATNAPVTSTSTDAAGSYSLSVDSGTYNVQAVPPAGSGFQSSIISNQVISSDTTLDFVLVSTTLVQVSGMVTDASNNAVSGVTITITRSNNNNVVASLTTAGNGTYITSIATGDYNFRFDPPSGSNLLPTTIYYSVTNNGPNIFNVSLASPPPPVINYTLSGKLLDGLGIGVPRQGVILTALSDGSANFRQTDDAGYYSFTVPAGNYWLTITSGNEPNNNAFPQTYRLSQANNNSLSLSLTRDTNLDLTVALTKLTVHVQDLAGNPVVGAVVLAPYYLQTVANVMFAGIPSQGYVRGYGVTNAAGNAEVWVFPNSPTGLLYKVRIDPPEGSVARNVILNDIDLSSDVSLTATLPIGNFQLSGKIIDPSGNSVVGACVTITDTANPSNVKTILSDANGNYSFTLFVGTYSIQVTPPVGSTLLSVGTSQIVNDNLVLNFTLPNPPPVPVTVSGKLLDGLGIGVPRQGVILTALSDGSANFRQTDDAGYYSFTVPAGNYWLTITSGNEPNNNAFPQTYRLSQANNNSLSLSLTRDTNLDLTVALTKLTVHVQDLAGNPVVGAVVLAPYYLQTVANVMFAGIPSQGYVRGYGVTNAAGNAEVWVFPNSPTGLLYKVRIDPPEGSVARNVILNDIDLSSDVSLTATLPIGNFQLSGKVSDPSGNPVIGATVITTDTTNSANVSTVTTDNSGNYAFSLFVGTYDIAINPPAGSTLQPVSVSSQVINDNTLLNFTLPAPPPIPVTVSGKVLDRSGNAIPHQRIWFYPAGGDGSIFVQSDDSGSYSAQFDPGNYRVKIAGGDDTYTLAVPQRYNLSQDTDVSMPITKDTHLDLSLLFKKVTVHVQDTNGNPIPNVNLGTSGVNFSINTTLAGLNATGNSYYGSINVPTDEAGNAVLWLLPPNPGGPSYTIYVRTPSESAFSPFTLGVNFTSDTNKSIVLEFVHAPPVTVVSTNPGPNGDGNYSGPVTVTLSATVLVGFNIDKIYYSLDGGPTQVYSGSFGVSGTGSHTLKYWAVDNIGVYEAAKTFNLNIVPPSNAVPALAGFSPTAVKAGSTDFTLTVSGTNFISGSVVRWNGTDLVTSYDSATQKLSAAVPAAKLVSATAANITVFNPAPGGGTSNPQAFFVTVSETSVSSSATSVASGGATSTTTGGSGAATPGSLTANATGTGTVTVALFSSNPGGAPNFASTGAFSDVRLSPAGGFSSLTIVNCYVNDGVNLFWWNGSGWAAVSNQNYDTATSCITVKVDGTTSPSLADLGGTYFAAAKKKDTSLTVQEVSGTYGGTVDLSASLNSAGTLLSGKVISFTLNGVAVCGVANLPVCPVTDANGKVLLSGVKLGSLAANSYLAGVGADFAGDNYYNSSKATNKVTVNKAVLTATAADASRVYGQANPNFTVNYKGFVNEESAAQAVSGSPSCTTTATLTSPPSPPTYPISCTVGTLTAANYSFTFVDGKLTISKAGTSLTLSSSVMTATVGQPVTFTAKLGVVAPGTGSPSGSISFKLDGTAVQPVVNLSNGQTQASFSTATLGVGTHTVLAEYSGDANFLGSAATALSQKVIYKICLSYDPTKAKEAGSTVPIKLQLCDFNNKNLSTASISVTALDVDGNPALLNDSGKANPGNVFRLDGQDYAYNLSSKGLSSARHTLNFKVSSDPGSVYSAQFLLK